VLVGGVVFFSTRHKTIHTQGDRKIKIKAKKPKEMPRANQIENVSLI
jgi:hypothetical protein